MNHTNGPWYRNTPPARKYVTVFAGRNTHVVHVHPAIDLPESEMEANLTLIAKAPELLEVLVTMVEEITTMGSPSLQTMERAWETIEKATKEYK